MALTPEWRTRLENFRRETKLCIYRELGTIEFKGFVTDKQLTPAEASKGEFVPMPEGTKWGAKWQYAWFKATVKLPAEAQGKRIQLNLEPGGESLIFVDGAAVGGNWHGGFANWGTRERNRSALIQNGKAGAVHELLLETYAGHGPAPCGNGPVAACRESVPEPAPQQATSGKSTFGIWYEEVYQLHMDVETLWQLREKLPVEQLRVSEIDEGLRKYTNVFDPELPWEAMAASAMEARKVIKPLLDCVNGSTSPEFFAFGHAHIDVAWLWPLQHTERKTGITFANQMALAAEYPEYRFLQSQPHLYRMLERRYPDIFARLKDAVKKGTIVPDGGMWVEADTNITGGESLIRQFIHGKRYFKEMFGVDNELLWLPDVFGYSGSLPQIMRGCGIKYFSTQKIYWNYNGGEAFPYVTFTWEGIDGSEILAHFHNDYNAQTHPGATIQRWNERPQKDGITTRLFPFGWGDGGGGPTRDHLEYARRQKNLEGAPKVRMASPSEFFKDLEKRGYPDPRYVGELYFQAHRGTYTSQAKTKRGNRKSEFALRDAELWAVVAAAAGKSAYPTDVLHNAWQGVLLNQFHDIIPGSSIARVYAEAEALYADILSKANRIVQTSCETLCDKENGISLFNSLNWERRALVALPAGWKGASDAKGALLSAQVADGKTYVEARVASCGTAGLKPATAASGTGNVCTASATGLENGLLKLTVNDSGEITSILDKTTGRELAGGSCNCFKMYKDVPAQFDAWDIDSMYKEAPVDISCKAEIRVVTQGPLFASIEIKKPLHGSKLTQTITLRCGSRRINFATVVDWQEKHKLLKVEFPTAMHSDTAVHEIQFGHLKRPNHKSRQFDADRFEVCCHKWSAIMEEACGCAVLNDSKYGVDTLGGSINLTLLRAAQAPDPTADLGRQEFTYSFYCWNGPFSDSELVREAYDLNAPVTVTPGLAADTSYLSADKANVVIETVKAAEDGSGDVIVRLYDAKRIHTRGSLTVNLPVKKAFVTDMLENNKTETSLENGKIGFTLKPFEILTLRLCR